MRQCRFSVGLLYKLSYDVQLTRCIAGGIGYTRGGQGDRIERVYREVKAIAIPGGSEEVSLQPVETALKADNILQIMLDLGVRQQIKIALGLGAKL